MGLASSHHRTRLDPGAIRSLTARRQGVSQTTRVNTQPELRLAGSHGKHRDRDVATASESSSVQLTRLQALRRSSMTLTSALRLDSGSAPASKRTTALPFASEVSFAATFPALEIVKA